MRGRRGKALVSVSKRGLTDGVQGGVINAMTRRDWQSRSFVKEALRRQSVWDLGNEVLYRLCREHPDHRSADVVLAKVWLIGRAYAAAIERRKDAGVKKGDDFYFDVVAPAIRKSEIDRWFAEVRSLRQPDPAVVVPVHKRLTDLFERISGLEKRSLASKYLHFHFPRAVYIYDARAVAAIRQVSPPLRRRGGAFERSDREYARFFERSVAYQRELEQILGRRVTPREVDKVLLAVSESK